MRGCNVGPYTPHLWYSKGRTFCGGCGKAWARELTYCPVCRQKLRRSPRGKMTELRESERLVSRY